MVQCTVLRSGVEHQRARILSRHPSNIASIANVVILIMAAHSRPKSFRDIMRYHHDFLVNPLQWTSRHLDLVGCRFEDVPTTPVSTESTRNNYRDNDGRKPCPKPLSDAEVIATNLFPIIKRRHLINILVGEERTFAYHR